MARLAHPRIPARRKEPAHQRDVPRAQSELVGLVLVLGLVLAGASTVVILGASGFSDSEETLSLQLAEKTLTQLDSKAALVALGNTDTQRVPLPNQGSGQYHVANSTGWMNITIQNTTSGNKESLVNQSLGSVTYVNQGDTISYQGGGVWRSSGNGSVMISPPEFHFRNGTLTVPIINLTGPYSLDGRATIKHRETVGKFPQSTTINRSNPLDEHRIVVEVQSDYYQAWGRYFEVRTEGIVKTDHSKGKVALELVSPLGKQTLGGASASRSASGTFELHGAAAVACAPDDIYTNSYNSSGLDKDYCAQTPGDEGHVVYGGDIDLSEGTGGDDLRGNLVSGASVNVTDSEGNGQPEIYGHINYSENCIPSVSDCQDRIMTSDTVNEISGVSMMNDINLLIETKVDDIQSSNDNSAEQNITSTNRLDFAAHSPPDAITLSAGEYYLHDIDMDADESLILDTSSGDITLAVEGGFHLRGSGSGGATIDVDGDGVAKLYTMGNSSAHGRSEWDVQMGQNSAFLTEQDNATQLRLYGRDSLNVSLAGSGSNLAKFVGVIFSPPGKSGSATVKLDSGEIYGGVLTGTTSIHSGSIHYDEALANTQVISRDAKVVKVTYLHVTVNQIQVSG